MDLFHIATLLFTPGSAPARFEKGLRCGADGVILDLEDAVAPADKDTARTHVFEWLARRPARTLPHGPLVAVRLNAQDSGHFQADHGALVQAIQNGNGPDVVLLPKVESAASLDALTASWPGSAEVLPGLVALIETARGLHQAEAIAQACPHIAALGFGGADLAADLGCAFAWEPLLHARSRMVQAAAMARIAVLDVPYLDIRDPQGLAQETRRAKELGFTGKFAIHPDQASVIAQAMRPDERAVQAARAIVRAAQDSLSGVCVVDGRMVDEPVIASARRMLARHQHAASRPCAQGD